MFLVYNNAFSFVLLQRCILLLFSQRKKQVPVGWFCKTHSLLLLLFVLKFFGTDNQMWGYIYNYVVIMLSEQLSVENDCKGLENKKMEKKYWVLN